MASMSKKTSLRIRNSSTEDIPAIIALCRRVYRDMAPYDPGMIAGQIANYPDGQFVVEYQGEIVGFAASFKISEELALGPHTWTEITGGGFAARHDPHGDWLYGMDVGVDPERRRLRIGQRLYDARRQLCESENLKGIVFGGRMPGWARRRRNYPDPLEYIEAVREKTIVDSVVNFHLRAGFEPIGVLPGYLPEDKASNACASHMVWRNPYAEEVQTRSQLAHGQKEAVRVATVQFQQRMISSVDEFLGNVEYFVDVCSDYRCDFVVFPELFTLQLLALAPKKLTPAESIETLTEYTPRLVDAMRELAISYNINIIGGSHPTRTEDGEIQNVAYVFLRDGSVHPREKIHPTPNERHWWAIQGGDEVRAIDTDCGPIGILICYDCEFPLLARDLAERGVEILLIPSCTEALEGYWRVRIGAMARALESQCVTVMASLVGNAPRLYAVEENTGAGGVFGPPDRGFPPTGVIAEGKLNRPGWTYADVDLERVRDVRADGHVLNLAHWDEQAPAVARRSQKPAA